ncbi:heterogeneous nuclear ribonucleoprotein R [Iris pallida]|uniref:Heterogeneous nuclear ribonucleoprotein R n=1 Tax=Iris pallida TaxID=29817 RepID=A0AAX6EE80_IRIPA|nr:heterogeneous nuclear ribonucleoprotein R [Iris pallida]
MSSANFKMDGSTPTISWADPKNSSETSAASQVKAVYVKNLPENVASEKLKELFERHGEVTKVVLPPSKAGQNKRDFGFIHFAERSSALKAVKGTEKYEIDGQVIEVVLAKPQADKKSDHASYKSGHTPNYPQYPSYGYGGDPSYGTGYGSAGFGQPMIYGRGPMPAGMRMVPMVLPDGRLGYVLQQPGAQASQPPPPSRRSDRGGGSRDDRGHDSGRDRGRRYRPY